MTDHTLPEVFDEHRFAVLTVVLWGVSAAVAVLAGDPPLVAVGYLFLPAVLVGWAGHVLSTVDGPSGRAAGGLLLLVGGIGEYAVYFGRAPNAEVFALSVVWLLGLLLVVIGERQA